jgi:hypothetical protein
MPTSTQIFIAHYRYHVEGVIGPIDSFTVLDATSLEDARHRPGTHIIIMTDHIQLETLLTFTPASIDKAA